MDILANIQLGLATALQPQNLLYAFIGCFMGTLIGVLPGLGPLATISMLLPLTYALDPAAALIMLAGIYYGAQYGGSTTAIMVNLPGESSSVVTAIDGYQLARKGKAGTALATAALSSFLAGTIATIFIAVMAKPLADVAFKFGPSEYFALMLVGLILATVLSNARLIESIGMVFLGVLVSTVGIDVNSGDERFTFGVTALFDGFDFVVIAMAIFGFAEIVKNLQESEDGKGTATPRITRLMPTLSELKAMVGPALRGTALGSLLGVLPGGGAAIASFASYSLEKKMPNKGGEEFGKGALAGIAGPEAANNAAAQTSFIPLLTLGMPSNAVMALMVGAMMIHDIQPGPRVMTADPALFWGLIASMWAGNLMLVVLNLPLVGVWVKLLSVPYKLLYPSIMLLCCIGVYSLKNDSFEIYLAAFFCVAGYLLISLDLPAPPLLLGFVLGPMLEENLRRALLISRGDVSVLFASNISIALYLVGAIAVLLMVAPSIRRKREIIAED
ncbi:tripartite tricarboxylate transporter permease [Aquamicrobium sp. LC103]|uniref:tripartite tricarboxylate transporter permease n=1 Tax=Aquamicrobium sp. LC103 TaxID=1120658 RepID=UPI00063EC34C|nr:tripartite tricarboxylate transporter permease [Aquamicrobium sp. LC103]TKT81058.1 tripartite tricarboxylate transporter permease [Aquamicrobium sp. LC103]